MFYLFSGKAYAIFAMMFGLSFFLIMDGAARRGIAFRGRFVWRLFLLAVIGYVFSLLYYDEVLSILAIIGLPLVFLYKASNRLLVLLSATSLLQLPFFWQLARTTIDPAYAPSQLGVEDYHRALNAVFAHGGLLEVCKVNAWAGVPARWGYFIGTGRCLQMLGLFLWGLLMGRSRVFENAEAGIHLARRAITWSMAALIALYFLKRGVATWGISGVQQNIVGHLFVSYYDLALMTIWTSGFVLLYRYAPIKRILRLLVPVGRTSLSGYVGQSIIGVVLFYPFGFGLYRYLGQFYSLLFSLGFFVLQCFAAHFWMSRFYYGPLEWLWRCCTHLTFQTPFRNIMARAVV